MEDPANVRIPYKGGKRLRLAGFDLAGIFAHLRLDVRQAERGEDVRFVLARHRARVVGERVLVERQAAVDGPLPHADVVLLAAGEVVQRERELLVSHHAEVGLERRLLAVNVHRGDHARLRRPLHGHLHHFGDLHERVHDRLRVFAAHQNVDVAGRLLPPAKAAAQFRADDAGEPANLLQERQPKRKREVDADAVADRVHERDTVENLLLRLRAEPLLLRHFPRFASRLQLLDGVDLKRVVQRLDLLRPHARQAEHLHQTGGHGGAQFVEVRQRAGGDERGDLLRERVADPANLFELPLRDHLVEVAGE